ncbi:TPA: hypothetical protein ACH3X2_010534 [Trebouxia sp. C0005]
MLKYRLHQAPYTALPADGELSTLKLYWQNIIRDDSKAQLPWLALFLLDIKAHAADPELTFSLMGWYHSARKNQLASKTTTALTTIKMYYNSLRDKDRQVTPQLMCSIMNATRLSCSWLMSAIGVCSEMNSTMHSHTKYSVSLCSAPQPIREVDMIMEKEQLIAGFANKKVTTKAIAAAVEASNQIDLTFASTSTAAQQPDIEELTEQLQDMSAFNPAEEVQLASTNEVLDLFSKYFEADSADAQSKNVAELENAISTDLDFNSKVFEPNYVSKPAASPLEHTQGNHTGTVDVRRFVARG